MIRQLTTKDSVQVTLSREEAEFIANELPHRDGFARDWWATIIAPMDKERERHEILAGR